MYSECPTEDWWGKPCWLNPQESGPDVIQGQGESLLLRPCSVPFWCETSKTIWNCCWPGGIPSCPMDVAPATSLEQKRAWKWMKWITFTLVYSPAWASQKFFKGWGKVDILLILFRLLTMPSTWTLTKPLPFQHYKGNAPCCGNSPKKYPSLTGMLLFHSCVFSHRRKLRG